MAFKEILQNISLIAGEDLSANQYRIVSVNNNGEAVLTGAGAFATGVVQNDPEIGQVASVGVGGVTKVVTGAIVVAGVQLESDVNGEAITFATGDIIGIALTGGASGDIISMLITHQGG